MGSPVLAKNLSPVIDHYTTHRVVYRRRDLDRVERTGHQLARQVGSLKVSIAPACNESVVGFQGLDQRCGRDLDLPGQCLDAGGFNNDSKMHEALDFAQAAAHAVVKHQVGTPAVLREDSGGGLVPGGDLVDKTQAAAIEQDRAVAPHSLCYQHPAERERSVVGCASVCTRGRG